MASIGEPDVSRPSSHRARRTAVRAAALLLGALLLAVLARALEPRAFLSGDSGVKLVATRQVLAHPFDPLRITAPSIGGKPVPELMGPFFIPHGDHAHANSSPLFPLVSAPFLSMFGERGLNVLPALGFLLTLWLTVLIRDAVEPDRADLWGVWLLAAGSPLLFYGLEVWEHTPAVALLSGATLAIVRAPYRRRSWIAAGALTGVAFLFRPEALAYGLALVILPARPEIRALLRRGLAFAAAFAPTQLPLLAYNVHHLHRVLERHLTSNAAGAAHGWWGLRLAILQTWFVDGAAAPVLLLIAGVVLSQRLVGPERIGRLLLWVAGGWLTVEALRRTLAPQSLWAAFPAAALALLPVSTPPARPAVSLDDLRRVALLFVALALLSAPNDGGSEWGPRYLLPACVPLALVAGRAIGDAVRAGAHRKLALAASLLVVAGSSWVQRTTYRQVLTLKRAQLRAAEELRERAGAATVVVSDLWWLGDRMTAASPPLTFLYAQSPDYARTALDRLAHAGVSPVLLVESSDTPAARFDGWRGDTCYQPRASGMTADRLLRFERVACASFPRP